MSRIAIDYEKLLALAEECRITRHGSRWIDAPRLIEAIDREAVRVRASTPNNIADILANGEKVLKQGKRYAPNLEDLAAMLGVTRQTLDKWRGADIITAKRERGKTGRLQYDIKAVLKDLKSLQNENQKADVKI